ncbi:ABC tran and/or AAA 21 domain containing protein [Asbolus verrucosus]|uniref:ABC tran and/or AAA 21 domain containing protein n=1 Tax=Asbolus verrucosus TaxID=1661398 RepID=A0A482W7B7_ASBVE|nr:ABC tran and/or AAA 21 domain containing protein [Asbolus verrucosus]
MANFVALTFYFLSCIPGALHYLEVTTLTLNERIASSILPNSGLLFGITLILKFEVNKEGVQWSNLNNPPVNEDLFLGAILVMFAIGTLLYTIIALCAEIIYPGDDLSSNNHEENFEKFSGNLPIGIELRNLSKTYGSGLAINNLNMTMYENHVTVLLGQDGTGKTTTISLISGIIPPSSGTAIVNGYDVRRDLKKARSSMGICLQHDILFDNLTVRENLYFFCQLKGLQNNESFAEANDFIQILEMKDKTNVVLKTLAEDMKRQLSVAIALCGKSKVVLLDEPTGLMDPSAKKKIWNMIQEQKRGRTIFLTTCNMDEAGLLGDRIAVMLDGEIICCGSSVFLKKKISIGYYLVLDVSPQCVPEKITELLSQYIPDIKIHSHTGPEITYQLSGKDSRKFPDMLAKLEGYDITQLGIRSFGISLSSLEEVISKGAADQNKKFSKDGIKPERTESNNLKVKYVDGCRLIINQVIAMLYKKFFSTLRAWPLLLSQIIITIALLLVALSSNIYSLYTNMTDELTIDLDKYQQPVILISGSKNTYYDAYKETLSKHEVLEVENISETILELVLHHLPPERKILIEILQTQNEPSTVKYRYIVGATFNPNKSITAWFNADAYHSTPLTLSLVLNTLYKVYVHAEKSMNDSRSVINSLKARNKIILLTWHLGFGVAFIAATFITFYIKERASKCKHLQFVSGIDAAIFWFTSLFCDLIIYFIIVGFIIAVFYVYQEQDFATSEELALLGIIAMEVISLENNFLVAYTVHWILLFIPHYLFARGIQNLSVIVSLKEICSKQESLEEACSLTKSCCDVENYYSMAMYGIGGVILISVLMFVILSTILIINDNNFFNFVKTKRPVQPASIDGNVEKENKLIINSSERTLNNNYILIIRHLTKYYKARCVINGLCLGVKPHECFGVLSVGRDGKTTMFKMLTGDEHMSFGDIWVRGLNLKKHQKKVQKSIGFCPQVDPLLDDLTARETLKIFALIRGVPYNQCKRLGETLAQEFDFYKYLDKKVKELSGGNKRKLSAAIALIGEPPVVYLDEPTEGMDSATKRYFWTIISKLREHGKCIVLTSRSLEECEALCTRIAVMVNGNFQYLGSAQRLKKKFAQDFDLTINVMKTTNKDKLKHDVAAIESFVKKHFSGAEPKEKYQELLSYQIPPSSMPWSKMFELLEENKKKLNIEDYSLGQCRSSYPSFHDVTF